MEGTPAQSQHVSMPSVLRFNRGKIGATDSDQSVLRCDFLLKVLVHDIALELHGGCDKPVLWGPHLGGDDDLLWHFEFVQATVFSSGLHCLK